VVLTRTKPVHSRRRTYALSRIELDTKSIPPGINLDSRELIEDMVSALKKLGVDNDVTLTKGSKIENGMQSVVVLSVDKCANKGVVYSTVDDICSNVRLVGNKLVHIKPEPSASPARDKSKRQARPGRLVMRPAQA
jgi:hypothetical protein